MTEIQTIDIKTIQTRLNITNCNDKFIHHQFTIHNAPKFEMCRMEVYFIALLHKGEVLIETDLTSQAIQSAGCHIRITNGFYFFQAVCGNDVIKGSKYFIEIAH